MSTIKTLNKYDLGVPLAKKPLPTQAERRMMVKPVSINPLGAAANLDRLINVISGRQALNKQARDNQKLETLVGEVRNSFSDEIFMEMMKIPSEEIIVFLFYCAEKPNLKNQFEKKINWKSLGI